jgi:hypothetical protein
LFKNIYGRLRRLGVNIRSELKRSSGLGLGEKLTA